MSDRFAFIENFESIQNLKAEFEMMFLFLLLLMMMIVSRFVFHFVPHFGYKLQGTAITSPNYLANQFSFFFFIFLALMPTIRKYIRISMAKRPKRTSELRLSHKQNAFISSLTW